jgi:hypothetical protein
MAEQAVKALISVLGYDIKAQALGGYPMGYMAQAQVLGLFNGVSGLSAGKKVTRPNLSRMLYNALHINLMRQTGYNDGGEVSYAVENGKTLLTEYFDIVAETGRVTGNFRTRLYDAQGLLGKDDIEIGGKIYKAGSTGAADYLGYTVKYYYEANDDVAVPKLVFVNPVESRDRATEIKYDEITAADSEKIEYGPVERKNANIRAARLSGALIVIFNGVLLPPSEYGGVFDLENGGVTLLDIDGDAKNDIAFINTYVSYAVDTRSGGDGIIFDKNGRAPINLKPAREEITYSIVKDKKEIEIEALREYDVLSVYASRIIKENVKGETVWSVDRANSRNYDIRVSNDKIEGEITEITDDNKYKINDAYYKISAACAQNTGKRLEPGQKATFYLDGGGFIVAVKTDGASDGNYGFMLGIVPKGKLGAAVEIQLLTKTNEVVIYALADRVNVNGGNSIPGDEVMSDVKIMASDAEYGVRKLIIYDLNGDGKISGITAAQDNTVNMAAYDGYDPDNFSKDFSGTCIYRNGKIFNLRYIINDGAAVFIKPKESGGVKPVEAFRAVLPSYFTVDGNYTIELYDVAKDFSPKAVVIIADNFVPGTMNNNSIAVVEKTAKKTDGDGGETIRVYYTRDGQRGQSLDAKDEFVEYNAADNWYGQSKKISELKRGDIIQYSTDVAGKIEYFRILFSADDPNPAYFQRTNASLTSGTDPGVNMDLYPSIYAAYGKVMRVNPGISFQFNARDVYDNRYNRTMTFSGANIYVYNSDSGSVSLTNSAEIYGGMNVFVRVNGTSLRDLVIIK